MTAKEIARRWLIEQDKAGTVTPLMRQKLVALCERMRVPLADVQALLPTETRDA